MTLIGSPIHSPARSPIILPHQGKWAGGFTSGVDFVAATAFGGFQTYGNNTNDGRLFRDPTNVVASFCPPNADGTGTLVSVASSGIRRTTAGQWAYPSFTNRALWNRDLTNAAWTKTNVTATLNQTGANGSANAATLLAATAGNGTVTQAITLASGQVVLSLDIKRVSGSGNIDLTVDGGTSWTTITGLTTSYQLKFITQAAVTNPTIGIRIVTSGDSVAVDFVHLITPSNSMNVPKQERVATTTATVLNSQSRPSADIADAAPNTLINMARGYFGFYWQGRSERATGAFPITGATGVFCSVLSTGSGGAVRFTVNAGVSTTADLTWKVGLTQVNKIAGYFKSDGTVKMAANGVLGSSGTGGTPEVALDHWDLSTNGAGQNSLYGVTEQFKMGSGISFTDAELISMTT
jgi:hypothetical protein